MIYRHNKKQVQEYRDAEGINQSYLKNIDNIIYFNSLVMEKKDDLYFEEKECLTIGNGVDTMLTNPDEFKDEFYISTLINKPTDKVMSVVKQVFDEFNFYDVQDIKLLDLSDFIIKACEEQNFYANYKNPTKIEKIVTEGNPYFMELLMSMDKTILSIEEYKLISTITNNILNNKTTGYYFQDGPDIDLVFQKPIHFIINGVKCKGLLDEIHIDHSKQLISPLDIKTMGDYVLNFRQNFIKRRYDFQGSFYYDGLLLCLKELSELIGRDVTKYALNSFQFIVESTLAPGNPVLFEMGGSAYLNGKVGNVTSYNGNRILGYETAIEDYKWYQENGFHKQRLLVENNDKIILGV